MAPLRKFRTQKAVALFERARFKSQKAAFACLVGHSLKSAET